MTPLWPPSLPQSPLGDSFAEQPPNLIVRSPMDVGPAKVRRRSTAGVSRLQLAQRATRPGTTLNRALASASNPVRAR